MALPAGLRADLDAVAALDRDEFRVFSPGDICPDNNLLTPQGLRPIDFEGAGFHSVFLDASGRSCATAGRSRRPPWSAPESSRRWRRCSGGCWP
jgi:hypothetical protein